MIKKLFGSSFIILFLVAIVTVCIVVGGIIVLDKSEEKITHKFLLPKAFTGWIEVYYEQSGYPALKKEDHTFIYEVPPTEKIMTSSKSESGLIDLYYVEQDGRLIEVPTDVPMIHEAHTTSGGEGGIHGETKKYPEKLTFFVGTEEQWIEAKKRRTTS